MIVATLAPLVGGLTFVELRDKLEMTDGNLSVHLQKLEERGYVEIEKKFVGRRPQTTCRLSKLGRKALARYLDQLEAIVKEGRVKATGA
jgi:DNA-binding MarR family transcriptional regulator